MPNDPGFLVDHESLQRIAKAVRWVERNGKPGQAGSADSGQDEGGIWVEVTGAAAVAGYYPAVEKYYDIEANVWRYAQDPCYAWEVNGGTLTVGQSYHGELLRAVVEGGVTKLVFSVQASGGGGTTGSTFVVVKVTTNLPPLQGSVQTYNEISHAWTDGSTVDLVEANGNNMPVGKRVLALKSGNVYIVGLDPVAVTSVVCNGGNLTVSGRN